KAHRERGRKLADARFALGETIEDRAASRIGEGAKNRVNGLGWKIHRRSQQLSDRLTIVRAVTCQDPGREGSESAGPREASARRRPARPWSGRAAIPDPGEYRGSPASPGDSRSPP